ncbi:hypothetical protein DFH09DRAFT_1097756 [Mycena vulgaris]|nr:hypothetical protein DFH09DRAFT_1097756 [Mycena vulgaris]
MIYGSNRLTYLDAVERRGESVGLDSQFRPNCVLRAIASRTDRDTADTIGMQPYDVKDGNCNTGTNATGESYIQARSWGVQFACARVGLTSEFESEDSPSGVWVVLSIRIGESVKLLYSGLTAFSKNRRRRSTVYDGVTARFCEETETAVKRAVEVAKAVGSLYRSGSRREYSYKIAQRRFLRVLRKMLGLHRQPQPQCVHYNSPGQQQPPPPTMVSPQDIQHTPANAAPKPSAQNTIYDSGTLVLESDSECTPWAGCWGRGTCTLSPGARSCETRPPYRAHTCTCSCARFAAAVADWIPVRVLAGEVVLVMLRVGVARDGEAVEGGGKGEGVGEGRRLRDVARGRAGVLS